MRPRFWELPLGELDTAEWEALCDGCGKCCLHKLEDEDTGELLYTRVACRFLDSGPAVRRKTGRRDSRDSPADVDSSTQRSGQGGVRCRVYATRHDRVPECVDLRQHGEDAFRWLPKTCAYRLRAADQPLQRWHPLVAGNGAALQSAGVSVRGRVLSEEHVHPDSWDEHVVRWV